MDHARFRSMIIEDLLPAIETKWPAGELSDPSFKIIIQQDGAGAHPSSWNDEVIQAAVRDKEASGTFTPGKIQFMKQPPNSPDTNICDLGLFNAIQSAYYLTAPKNEMEIITMVKKTFDEYPHPKIDRLFVTLQSVNNTIIEHYGDNFFKIPHMNKDKMERDGTLPKQLPLSPDAIHIMNTFNSGGEDPPTDSDVDFDEDDMDEISDILRGVENGEFTTGVIWAKIELLPVCVAR